MRRRREKVLKRKRNEESEEESQLDPVEFNDTYNAIRLLIQRYETHLRHYVGIGFVLKHQLYQIIPNRTAVDQDLFQLRQQGVILLVHLQTIQTDAIVLLSSYQSFMKRLVNVNVVDLAALSIRSDCLSLDRFDPTTVPVMKRAGFLLPRRDLDTNGEEFVQFSIPQIGKCIGVIVRARKELLRIISVRSEYDFSSLNNYILIETSDSS